MNSTVQKRVRVPASTSNLGPGFDVFGLALNVELEVECLGPAQGAEHQLIELTGTAIEWPRTQDNVLFRAFDRVARQMGAPRIAHEFRVHSAIPVARGLGSSGAACAAGLLLGAEVFAQDNSKLTREQLVHLGIELEGHPENSTASLLGGAVLCVPEDDGTAHVVRQPIAPNLRFVVAWPSTRIATQEARAVLPEQVAFADAVENPRRLALLLEGFRTGEPTLLRAGIRDQLHAKYRLPLIAGAQVALDSALAAGAHCATISGSGSTLIALCDEGSIEAVRDAFEQALAPHHETVTAREVLPVLDAPQVVASENR